MKKITGLCLVFYFCFVALYAQKLPSQIGYVDNGRCSYFINDRGGALTRSGEKFNMNAMEGGHPLIPFGALARITNLDNQKSVIIRINDRPYSNRRILDVTHAVAQKLGMLTDSVASVYVQVVVLKLNVPRSANGQYDQHVQNEPISPKNEIKTQNVVPASGNSSAIAEKFKEINLYTPEGKIIHLKGYAIQVAGFGEVEKSIVVAQEMTAKYNRQFYVQSGWSKGVRYYRVVTGEYADKESAQKSLELLKSRGITGFVRPHFK